jgi:hypothetical protein
MEDSKVDFSDCLNWATAQFAGADLGDKRRSRRLVRVAAAAAAGSSGSLPQQTGGGADLKAAYRLFDAEEVTHAAVCATHFELTRRVAEDHPMVFLVQDTTELNFTTHKACKGLAPIGQGNGLRGLHQQNMLAVDPLNHRLLGLIYQQHHRRTLRPKGTRGDRRAVPVEERESYWWIQAIRKIGTPPQGCRWVHLGDRGEDIFGVYLEARHQGADWLIRVAYDRRIYSADGKEEYLFSYARRQPVRLRRTISVPNRQNGRHEPRELCVSAAQVKLRPARHEAQYRKCEPVACWVVRVWEENPPAGYEPLEWLLCTSLPCDDDQTLGLVAAGYGDRWMIEEFHKCEKTGCQVESRRLEDTDRLEPLIGVLSIVAVRLLQLKFLSRDEPELPARSMFSALEVKVMSKYLRRPAETLTLRLFWRGIGRLGGHPGRKGDGPLGWLRAWRGWQRFELMVLGAELYARDECG